MLIAEENINIGYIMQNSFLTLGTGIASVVIDEVKEWATKLLKKSKR